MFEQRKEEGRLFQQAINILCCEHEVNGYESNAVTAVIHVIQLEGKMTRRVYLVDGTFHGFCRHSERHVGRVTAIPVISKKLREKVETFTKIAGTHICQTVDDSCNFLDHMEPMRIKDSATKFAVEKIHLRDGSSERMLLIDYANYSVRFFEIIDKVRISLLYSYFCSSCSYSIIVSISRFPKKTETNWYPDLI